MPTEKLAENPILHAVAAVSVGIVDGRPLLDLCYTEDVAAAVDMNLVMNSAGEFIELQGTGEEATFSETQLADLLALGKSGIRELLAAQEKAIAQGLIFRGQILSKTSPPQSHRRLPSRDCWLIRHAEVETRYQKTFGGRIDMNLSPRGREQAEILAKLSARQNNSTRFTPAR